MGVFKKGHKINIGKKKPGAGRPPDWFRHVCLEELKKDRYKAVLNIGKVARGEMVLEKVFCHEGAIIRAEVRPSPEEMRRATEFLRDSAGLKPVEEMNHSGKLTLDQYVGLANPVPEKEREAKWQE